MFAAGACVRDYGAVVMLWGYGTAFVRSRKYRRREEGDEREEMKEDKRWYER